MKMGWWWWWEAGGSRVRLGILAPDIVLAGEAVNGGRVEGRSRNFTNDYISRGRQPDLPLSFKLNYMHCRSRIQLFEVVSYVESRERQSMRCKPPSVSFGTMIS